MGFDYRVSGLLASVLGAQLVAAGCGGNNKPPPVFIDAGPDAPFDAPGPPDGPIVPDAFSPPDANISPDGPIVALLSPSDGDTILGPNLQIQLECQADSNGATMSPVQTVKFELFDEGGHMASAIGVSDSVNTWKTQTNLGAFANGTLTVRCLATAADGKAQVATAKVTLDLGPKITISRPAENEATNRKIVMNFRLAPAPTSLTDTMAAVTDKSVTIAGRDVTSFLSDNGMGTFTGSIDANDPTFGTQLSGQVTFKVTASDARGAARVAETTFVVDTSPPTITILKPAAGELVGGVMEVQVKITDATGVDDTSVVAVLGHGIEGLATIPLAPVPMMAGTFSGHYDTRQLKTAYEAIHPGSELIFPTLSIRANDLPGNPGTTGEVIAMDYTPPIVSLNPPFVREGNIDTASNKLVCSVAFDPLGEDAVDPFQTVGQLSEFRVRIEDQPNTSSFAGSFNPSGVVLPLAGVDDSSVQLFILPVPDLATSPGDALVVDSDGDANHSCDDINPLLHPTTLPTGPLDILEVDMVPIEPAGASFFAKDDTSFQPIGDEATCTALATAAGTLNPPSQGPAPLCISTGLQRVIKTPTGTGHVIYGVSPKSTDSCLGAPIDSVANNIPDGWACVAVRVTDKLGNVGVSPPMPVCFSHDDNPAAHGCAPLPVYGTSDRDVPNTSPKFVPAGSPPPGMDCLGTFDRTGMISDPNNACNLPPDFPQFQVIRTDR